MVTIFTETCKQLHLYWCGICKAYTQGLCRNYEGCKARHRFNICEECARKEGYLW